ncbi:probable serine hydrolase [Diaphorina citri]|uniref:Probable serine hydrolase n=1 Tax=Diaphorina citri TaxID=121845 RepID=A0A3Q0JEI6_DIACI|nr:probable serine hydrolase [Diaphorina citri]
MMDNVLVLRRIMGHYGWKRISLMGHSMGCNVSFVFTALYPDEVGNNMLRHRPHASNVAVSSVRYHGTLWMEADLTDGSLDGM